MINNNELIKSNIAGLNPTGTINYAGTFTLNGSNNIVQYASSASKSGLNSINNNKVVCSNIENFENFENYYKSKNINMIILLIIIIIFIIIFLY